MMGTIYRLHCLANGKGYVGKTVQRPTTRFIHHLCDARKGSALLLHRAIRKHGVGSFMLVVLEERNVSAGELNEMEKQYIKISGTLTPDGYNLTLGGDGRSGMILTPEHKAKLHGANKGNKYTLGYRHTPESKAKIAAANSRIHLGKKRSTEARAKMSAARQNFHHTDESRRKIATSLLGRIVSQETRNKISVAQKGKPLSPEHVRKLCIAAQRRWARVRGEA